MLARGVRLGTFEVLEPLGTGGMGEVFRAHDARLGRDVALKVLSGPFKLDAQRRARFEREARVLASLNHPNIATLHGLEESGDTQALVLELVDGATLAERIADGPIPLPEALVIAQQIGAALDEAHEHGIVHRDLKPDNIKLRPDGTVKLLDFGLAKVFAPEEGGERDTATVTAVDVATGAVMGTPAYMSPEQARGLTVDKRADIWAFGCVLYEMLTGKRAFAGERASDVVAQIIEREPDLTFPPQTPAAIRRLVRHCLAKDSRKRLRDIGDARLALTSVQHPDTDELGASAGTSTTARRAALMGTLAAATAIAAVLLWLAPRVPSRAGHLVSAPVARFAISPNVRLTRAARALAISADGARLAYATDEGLFVRERDRLIATRVEGLTSPAAGAPFFSPDGKWVGFTDGQRLKKVPAEGGAPITITEGGPAATGNWAGKEIVFANSNGLYRVVAEGGPPELLPVKLGALEQALYPQLLPERHAIIFTVIPTRSVVPGYTEDSPGARVEVLDLVTKERRTLLRGAGRAQYTPTGHLIYAAGEALYAVAFDLEHLEVRGNPTLVVSNVTRAEFALSEEGTLVYLSGPVSEGRALVWVDRHGREEPIDAPPRDYKYPRLSPDGTRIALDTIGPADRDILMWDLGRKTLERFTLDSAANPLMAWDHDGRQIAFGSDRFGPTNLFLQAADGSGDPRRLLVSDRVQQPMSFAPDGRLIFSADVPGRGRDIDAVSVDGTARVEHIIHSAANDLWAEVSPDGRWIAYDSDESGQMEVYVRPYPRAYSGGRWQISSGGGRQPLWSRDGRELFYRDFSGAVFAAPITLAPAFAAGPAIKLFAGGDYVGAGSAGAGRAYDLSRDGRRFLMLKELRAAGDTGSPAFVVVLNWFEELRRLASR
jgi:eukaryotic-like serine/threonine-protein kinase